MPSTYNRIVITFAAWLLSWLITLMGSYIESRHKTFLIGPCLQNADSMHNHTANTEQHQPQLNQTVLDCGLKKFTIGSIDNIIIYYVHMFNNYLSLVKNW